MSNFSKLKGGVPTLVLGIALLSSPAMAQEQEDDAGAEAIVVTGSRIARPDLESTSPLTVVAAEEFKLTGQVNVESVLNTLPSVVPGTTAFSNNPGGGVATLNLRGLGSQRNLVLVNGRRWMFYSTNQTVDLNTIPQFLIEGVDVVTGGASAVYGSDAIAGVVNFRLRNVVGVEMGSQYSITEEGDGARFNANIAIGAETADGRGKVTVFGEYYDRKPIFQDQRDFSFFALGDGATSLVPLGSSTIPAGRLTVPGTATVPAGNGLPALSGATALTRGVGAFSTALGGIFGDNRAAARPYIGAGAVNDSYNYAPANYLQVPQERWLLGGYGEYEITDGITAYTEVAFVNNRVVNELAPTPLTGAFQFNINALAPGLSAADVALFRQIDANEAAIDQARIARGLAAQFSNANGTADGVITGNLNKRLLEIGSRAGIDERSSFRALAGFKGSFAENWNYDAYYFYSRNRNSQIQNGNVSRSRFQAGLLNGTVNPFGNGSITPAAATAISIVTQNATISTLEVATASVTGTPFNLGLGAQDVGVAFGAEYRTVGSEFIPDTALSSGDVIGFNAGQPTKGNYNVAEIFGELDVPILADRPFFHRLGVRGAARYSDYSLQAVGGVFTWAASGEWAPIPDITFRGGFQKAVRAPNVGELFGGQSQGFPPATDPCSLATARTNATINALCVATGVPASQVGAGVGLQPNAQIEGLFGGNPNLGEERSESYTIGAVIRPQFIRGLNITVDYFNITVDNVITVAGGGVNNILNLCYNVIQNANSPICNLINREPNTGIIQSPFVVAANNANLASLETSGIDVQVDYSTVLPFGLHGEESRLAFSFLGTWTDKNITTPVAALPNDIISCAGKFGLNCGDPQSTFKWTSRLSWVDGPFTTSVRWRHLSATRDDDDATDFIVERIKAYNFFDLTMSVDVTDNVGLTAGVNNLFNKKPPIIGDNQEQANTYPGTFDVLGRDFFVSARLRF